MRRVAITVVLAAGLAVGCTKNTKKTEGLVVLETNKGKITVQLETAKAPLSSKNFLAYVDAGFYEGTVFHRVIPRFMIQGGGFTKELSKKPTREAIQNEADNGLSNARGTLAMARTSAPNSATSQFFINVADNARLDHTGKNPRGWGYAVFGKVVGGMDVVDAIENVKTRCPSNPPSPCSDGLPPGMRDVPADPVIILKASRAD
jgi:cyclophilin family peptidyl-prolyl cis-trans isomerase